MAALKQMTWDEFETELSKSLPGFKRREIQATLAVNALDSLQNRRHILAQAGCGTGKTFIAAFAALMMALQTGKPSVIATATKALQDQYAEKDLPFLASLFDGIKFTILKGRSNYVCLQKVNEMEGPLKDRILKASDAETFSGEVIDLGFDVEAKTVVSTSDECPGKKDCPFGSVCFAERAKTQAKESHIVVANHAVVAVDLMVKQMQEEVGIPEDKTVAILPQSGTMILDEAHEFQDVVTDALGGEITAGSYGRLAKEINNWFGDSTACNALNTEVASLFAVVGKILASREKKQNKTLPLTEANLQSMTKLITSVSDEMAKIKKQMLAVQVHGNDKLIEQRKRITKRVDNASVRLRRIVLADEETLVRWLELGDGRKGDAIAYAPLLVDDFLRTTLWERQPSMLMSATLALGNDFSFMREQLGID